MGQLYMFPKCEGTITGEDLASFRQLDPFWIDTILEVSKDQILPVLAGEIKKLRKRIFDLTGEEVLMALPEAEELEAA